MSSRASGTAKDANSLRIVLQHRDHSSMIYELSCNGAELDLRFTPRAGTNDPGEWRIEARPGREAGVACVTEWAATRAEALRAVGLSWVSSAATHRLPRFDWEAVAAALTAVRAL
jgi:hypothetical protein